MIKWGRCADVGELVANVTVSAGATGVWDAVAGTFTATLPPGGACGGTTGFPFAELSLVANGCGTLRVTVDGVGERFSTVRTFATVTGPGGGLNGTSEGGGHTDCSTSPLQFAGGIATIDIEVVCGDELTLSFYSFVSEFIPEITTTFVVQEV